MTRSKWYLTCSKAGKVTGMLLEVEMFMQEFPKYLENKAYVSEKVRLALS